MPRAYSLVLLLASLMVPLPSASQPGNARWGTFTAEPAMRPVAGSSRLFELLEDYSFTDMKKRFGPQERD